MLVYRVVAYRSDAAEAEPGHPGYLHPDQGFGRWDNPTLYRALYVAASASGAVGETFAHLSTWSRAMLASAAIDGAERVLSVYSMDEEAHPLLDLDDPRSLLERGLRPTDVVIRNRPRTQQIARGVFEEGGWSGLSWWSMHRPQWTLYVLWAIDDLTLEGVERIRGHPATSDAGRLLAKHVDADLV